MANTYAKTRTNYFKVTDIEGFKQFLDTVCADDFIEISLDDAGEKISFDVDGFILGVPPQKVDENDDDDDNDDDNDADYIEPDYDEFIYGIQEFLTEDDACIITRIEWEKMRFIEGFCNIITKNEVKSINLSDYAIETARKMLGNADWTTQNDY